MSNRIVHNHYPHRGEEFVQEPGKCPACDVAAIELDNANTGIEVLSSILEGHSVVRASPDDGELKLDDGTVIHFDLSDFEGYAWFELDSLNLVSNTITKATITEQYEDPQQSGVGRYDAQISVITETGESKYLAEGYGDAANGCLDGFYLGLTIIPGKPREETHLIAED